MSPNGVSEGVMQVVVHISPPSTDTPYIMTTIRLHDVNQPAGLHSRLLHTLVRIKTFCVCTATVQAIEAGDEISIHIPILTY